MVEIKRSNPKIFEQLDVRFKELQALQTKVGWFENARYENGTSVAYVAAIQEMGFAAKNIPPRPFMRPTVLENEKKYLQIMAQGAKQIVNGQATANDVMELLGEVAQSDVSKSIVAVTSPQLRPATIKARQARGNTSIKPLNDTGLMIATVTHVVENANT